MIEIEDADFEAKIRKALAANPEMAEAVVALMVEGCATIERFEENIAAARTAPLTDTDLRDLNLILDDTQEAFGNMLDVFGDLLNIATGVTSGAGDI